MREAAFRNFNMGEFQAAIPEFQMLIETLQDVKSSQGLADLEPCYYNLAISFFMIGQFEQAEAAFIAYCKKYPRGARLSEAFVYIADSMRFASKNEPSVKAYQAALSRFNYGPDMRADIYSAIARCYLAMDDWDSARAPLLEAFRSAPDFHRRNRAATLLATSYLKTLKLEDLYPMVPYLLRRDSHAARSIAFNLSALKAGDELFMDERYREAFWMFRLVFSYEEVQQKTEEHLEYLKRLSDYEKRYLTNPRRLMRIMEWIGDTEFELKALAEIEDYDQDLFYRIARGYMETKRYREACEGFLHLNLIADRERAEESLYLAFVCAARLSPPDRCYTIGRQYMERYPAGKFYDDLTLLIGQMYAQVQRWTDLISHLSEVLQVRPQHSAAAEALFLISYAHFMEEQFEQAITRLRELRQRFPGWEQIDAAIYWSAMALMFDGDFETAEKEFTLLLQSAGNSNYAEDASYRRAVCKYALGDYDTADNNLAALLQNYPESSLRFEAHMLRADIAGTVGRLDDAVAFYQEAIAAPDDLINIEFYNHSAFQAGQILYDSEKFEELRTHFASYIRRNREGSNVPLAVFWTGKALFNLGEHVGAVRYYRDAVTTFGQDRKAMGVDLILDEWIATTRRLSSNDVATAWSEMEAAWKRATATDDHVGRLRYQRVLLYRPGITPSVFNNILSNIMQPENLEYASPAVMETMFEGAMTRHQTNFATRIANAIVTDYPETDIALDARMLLARTAIAESRTANPADADKLLDAAIEHLDVVRGIFATSSEAAEALLLLGTIYRDRNRLNEAQECLEAVLGVRNWRNFWPEALYGLGLCMETRRDWERATPYYERIYLMYSGSRHWTAKAYLRRAESLNRLYKDQQALETLVEMLAQDDLRQYPEFVTATELHRKLEGRK
jgi:TolA-binding protein